MKTYPSIPKEITNHPIYAFDKLDGNNIRAEWVRKKGFSKFGTRKRLLDENEETLGQAKSLFLEKYSESLEEIFRKERWEKAVAFLELHGPSSFAGQHEEDEKLTVTLLDVSVHKKGILEPKSFLKIFKNVEHAPLLYSGNPNQDFVESVKDGSLEGMTFEGVVCKGKNKSPGLPLMFKIKSREWIEKLKIHCKDDEKKFLELL